MKIKLVFILISANWISVDQCGLPGYRIDIGKVKIGQKMMTQLMRQYWKPKVGE